MILGLAFATTEEAKKEIEPKKAEETDKKQDKRGLFGLGYGYGAYDGYGYGSLGHEGKQCNIMRKHFFPPLDKWIPTLRLIRTFLWKYVGIVGTKFFGCTKKL